MTKTTFRASCIAPFAALILVLCLTTSASAQRVMVPFNGMVTDVAGQPIKKVKVYNYDAKRFTMTDKRGRFGLTNVAPTDTLHLAYAGRLYDIPVNGMQSMRIRLADQLPEVQQDDELVDLGMGFVKRREFTGSSSGLSGEELVRMGYTDLVTAIVDRVPGVNLIGTTIVIRGINSINLPLEPLFLLDGVTIPSLSGITLYEVDHIEVIKDANMYGARGANGVISITTKRGK